MCGAGGGGGGGGGILPTSIIAVQGAVVHAAGLGWGFLGNFLLFPPPPPPFRDTAQYRLQYCLKELNIGISLKVVSYLERAMRQ